MLPALLAISLMFALVTLQRLAADHMRSPSDSSRAHPARRTISSFSLIRARCVCRASGANSIVIQSRSLPDCGTSGRVRNEPALVPDESNRYEERNSRSRPIRSAHQPVLLACAVIATLAGCARSKTDPSADTKVETNTDPNVFTLPHPEQFPLVEVELRKVTDELHVNGVIAPDVNRSVPVVSLGGGRVVEIKAKLGDSVRKGQTLLLINSPDLSQAFSDYQKFKADEQLAAKQLARAQLLYDKGAIALADLETAQDADAKAKVDTQTAAQHIKVLGGNHQ